jgi:YD repeat-containing protein
MSASQAESRRFESGRPLFHNYSYDYENRIIKIKKTNDAINVAEYSYDALGRRIEKKDCVTSANTRRYYYNNNWQILAEYNGSNTFKNWYAYGNYIDEVLLIGPAGGGARY